MNSLDPPSIHPQFRRPWSPNPYTPFTSPPQSRNNHHQDNDEPESYGLERQQGYPDITRTLSGHQRRSREPSDVSVEALDLADYARTLRPRQIDDHINPQDLYTRFPRSPPHRSNSSATSHHRVPSLASRGNNTLSTSTHSFSSGSRRPAHRPYSLPDTARIQSTGSPTQLSHGHGAAVGNNAISNEAEVDITKFPAWSRGWYPSAAGRNNGAPSPPNYDLDTPPPARISMFDPSYKHKLNYCDNIDSYSLPPYGNSGSTQHHTSLREYYLPWSSDPLENGMLVNAETKEERMRMLEREFGQKSKPNQHDAFTDENGKPLVGTVDANGNIVTQGPKKRALFRVLQILLALVAGGPSIYAALFIKPKKGTPPPAGKLAAFVLYAVSIITVIGMLYLHAIRPCCGGRRKGQKTLGENPLLNGMMVLPVQDLPGGKDQQKTGKGKKKGKRGDVQVNLIVDPNAFGIGGKDDREDEEEGWGSDDDDTYTSRKRRKSPRRRSVFVGLAMEKEWKRARAWLKKMSVVDAAGLVVWGATFVVILLGKRCASGGYDGWCNAYNTSSAAACLLCVAFGVSVFFDVKDIYGSKANPRTRT